MSNIKATILVAMDQNRAIGKNGQLLCRLPKDLKAFKEMTTNQVVIMGRKTQESLPNGYLDKRHNIVITSQNLSDDRLIITHSPIQALLRANVIVQNSNNIATGIFVIGGQQIYQEFIKQDLVDEIIITQILHKFEQCDAFFPQLELDNWRTASKSVKITDGDYKTERHVYAKIEACTENILSLRALTGQVSQPSVPN